MSVTQEQINEWKTQHEKVFKLKLGGEDYYYTTLKRDVYLELLVQQQANENFEYEFETVKACVLYPEIKDSFKKDMRIKSGLGVVLLEQIMLNSGWEQVESEEL